MRLVQKLLQFFTGKLQTSQIYQHQMVICTTGYDLHASVHQTFAECFCILQNLLLISLEFRLKCFFKAYRFCSDHMFQRTSLNTWKYCFIEVELLSSFFIAQDHTASWSTQCLVCCSCYYISVRNRTRMQSCCYQTCNVCNICHQICSYLISNLTEFLEINRSGISACSRNNHLRLLSQCDLPHIIIIDKAFIIDSIRYDVKIFTGNIHR